MQLDPAPQSTAMRSALSRRPASRIPRSGERGVALIEVLVALLIFMLGIVGLMGMQTSLTRAQTESKIRADAAYLATEAIGRMWADVQNLSGYAGTTECTASSCTEWRSKVQQVLPGGNASITVDGLTGDVLITLTWTTQGGDTHKYVTGTTIAAKTAG